MPSYDLCRGSGTFSPTQPCRADTRLVHNLQSQGGRAARRRARDHMMLLPSLLVVPLEGYACRSNCALRWSSKLATGPLRDKADWPLTARFDEHRPKCNNKFYHACALGEHKRPTAFVFPLPACALRSKGAMCVSFRSYSGVRVQ
jgi:hypothetical protein